MGILYFLAGCFFASGLAETVEHPAAAWPLCIVVGGVIAIFSVCYENAQ